MNNYILYSEVNIICLLILALLSIKVVKSMFIQEQRRLFLKVSISNIIFVSLDLVWTLVNNNPANTMTISVWLIDAAYYVASGLIGWFWFWYSETVQKSKFAYNKKFRFAAEVPFIILIILIIASYNTGWLFYIDETNHFHRGNAYFIILIFSYGYVLFTAVKAFFMSFRAPDYHKKRALFTLSMYILPTILSGMLQFIFSKYPILCAGNTLGILYIYLTLQEQLIILDPLTKLNNRNQLMQMLSLKISHYHPDKDLYLLIMDVDYFKSINDKYGHIEGDKALKKVADILLQICSDRTCSAYRFGGDEFVILSEVNKDNTVDELCDKIHSLLKNTDTPYKLSLSIGYAKYHQGIKNQQEFIDLADQQLYIVKENRIR